MRKEIRQLLAELLAAELARVDPPFTQVGAKSTARLRYTTQLSRQQFVLDIVARDCDEAFSADLVWGSDGASRISLCPADLLGHPGGSIRIDLLWSNGGHWWTVTPPPPPTVTRRSVRDIFRQSNRRITIERASDELPGLVRDFTAHVAQYVIPYMHQITARR